MAEQPTTKVRLSSSEMFPVYDVVEKRDGGTLVELPREVWRCYQRAFRIFKKELTVLDAHLERMRIMP